MEERDLKPASENRCAQAVGVGRYLKEQSGGRVSVAVVEPTESRVLSGKKHRVRWLGPQRTEGGGRHCIWSSQKTVFSLTEKKKKLQNRAEAGRVREIQHT